MRPRVDAGAGASPARRASRTSSAPATAGEPGASPFVVLDRPSWSALRESTPLTLTEDDVRQVQGLGDPLDLREVEEVYLPLSRLLNLQVAASQGLHEATATFLGERHGSGERVPYVIGVA
ncbi:MAG: hypothetical protein ACTHNT_06705, partial [Actinomycetales bacterium]